MLVGANQPVYIGRKPECSAEDMILKLYNNSKFNSESFLKVVKEGLNRRNQRLLCSDDMVYTGDVNLKHEIIGHV